MEQTTAIAKQEDVKLPDAPFASASNFEHIQRVAKMFAQSSLVPKDFQGNIQNIIIALEMANRIGASPLAVMQNIYIVHGKPSWSSTFIIAAINSCQKFSALRFEVDGEGETLSCYAWAYESASGEKLKGPTITMKMAKAEGWIDKNGSKWKTMPDLMIRYRAAAFFGRLYAPEIMMGMQTIEEVVDVAPAYQENVLSIDELKALYQEVLPELTKSEMDNAKRIIDNAEEKSYKKLHTLLTSKKNG